METQNIEYKSSWHDEYLKWICGFANASGGVLFIGKNNSGVITGITGHLDLMEALPNKIRESMGLVLEVHLKEDNNLYYIEIMVPPSSVPISLRGRYYKRSGNTNMELTGPGLTDFLMKKSGLTWDAFVEDNLSLSDINKKSVNKFFDMAALNGRLPEGLADTELIDVLVNLRLAEGAKIRRAAILLFGMDPRKYFVNSFAKIGRFGNDETDLLFQDVIEGDILSMPERIIALLETKYLIRPVAYEGIIRMEKALFPFSALREIIINAIVHREFTLAPVQIKIFSDRIEVWNPGSLPHGMSIEDLEKPHASQPANPVVADVFFKAGLVESWGRGTLRVINELVLSGLPKPQFRLHSGGILVTVFREKFTTESLRITGLNERQIQIVEFLKTNSSISNKQYREKFDISNATAFRELSVLLDNKIIKRSGVGKKLVYVLNTD